MVTERARKWMVGAAVMASVAGSVFASYAINPNGYLLPRVVEVQETSFHKKAPKTSTFKELKAAPADTVKTISSGGAVGAGHAY